MAIIASGIMTVVTDSFQASASHSVKPGKVSITVLQTADIHGQLDSHPELFRENGRIVLKNAAVLLTSKRYLKMSARKTREGQ